MNKIENYLGVANHDIQMANNSQELKSYVASILYENDELQQENKKYKEVIDKAINDIDLVIKLIKQQPAEDDSWILYRLNGFKNILKEAYKEVK